jgi:hypothetical protein
MPRALEEPSSVYRSIFNSDGGEHRWAGERGASIIHAQAMVEGGLLGGAVLRCANPEEPSSL